MTTFFSPSPEQARIYDWLENSQGNLLVQACPGSGKTTTILNSFCHIPQRQGSLIPPRIVYLVFNKRNQLEAVEKLKNMDVQNVEVSTFHSLGMRALKASGKIEARHMRSKDFVNSRKVPKLVWGMMDRDDPDVGAVIKLVSLLKQRPSPQALHEDATSLCAHFEIDLTNDKSIDIVLKVLEKSNADLSCIDFDDMLYLPVILGVSFTSYDYIFVDEAQDTNDVQSEILFRSCKPTQHPTLLNTMHQMFTSSRLICVGDPFQAIYGFRGANSDAMTKLKERFNMSTLPLSVSYRCPQAVVREAQKFC